MADDLTPMVRAAGAGSCLIGIERHQVDEGGQWQFSAEEAAALDPAQWVPVKQAKSKAVADAAPAAEVTSGSTSS